jgi:hypothetical protein
MGLSLLVGPVVLLVVLLTARRADPFHDDLLHGDDPDGADDDDGADNLEKVVALLLESNSVCIDIDPLNT